MKSISQKTNPQIQNQSAAEATAQSKGIGGVSQFEDKRPAATVQRQLHTLMDRSNTGQRKPLQNQRQKDKKEEKKPKEELSSKPLQRVVTQMKAGVDSFNVRWSKNAASNASKAWLRLDYTAKFKDDGTHSAADAEFRQNASEDWKVTAGTHSGQSKKVAMCDDNYSRGDDTGGNAKTDVDFVSEDNPGMDNLAADDVVDYKFEAEQMIIDTSDGDKVIAKKGPNSATIKGAHPRNWDPALPFNA